MAGRPCAGRAERGPRSAGRSGAGRDGFAPASPGSPGRSSGGSATATPSTAGSEPCGVGPTGSAHCPSPDGCHGARAANAAGCRRGPDTTCTQSVCGRDRATATGEPGGTARRAAVPCRDGLARAGDPDGHRNDADRTRSAGRPGGTGSRNPAAFDGADGACSAARANREDGPSITAGAERPAGAAAAHRTARHGNARGVAAGPAAAARRTAAGAGSVPPSGGGGRCTGDARAATGAAAHP